MGKIDFKKVIPETFNRFVSGLAVMNNDGWIVVDDTCKIKFPYKKADYCLIDFGTGLPQVYENYKSTGTKRITLSWDQKTANALHNEMRNFESVCYELDRHCKNIKIKISKLEDYHNCIYGETIVEVKLPKELMIAIGRIVESEKENVKKQIRRSIGL